MSLNLRRSLWLCLASLTVMAHISMVHATQESATMTLMAVFVWGGALLCLEDQLPALDPAPSAAGMAMAVPLLVISLWATASVLHLDKAAHLLAVWLGLGLALLCLPLRQLKHWRASLLTLCLLPLAARLISFPPLELPVSLLSARLSQVLLLLAGLDASVAGRTVMLAGGAVKVQGPCNGLDQIAQMLVTASVFLLAFPLPERRSRWLPMLLAPIIGLLGNVIRIAILALINGSSWPHKGWWFQFVHHDAGSYIFAGLTVGVFGWIYMLLLESQLQKRTLSRPSS